MTARWGGWIEVGGPAEPATVVLSVADAETLFHLAATVEDRAPQEQRALDRLAEMLDDRSKEA